MLLVLFRRLRDLSAPRPLRSRTLPFLLSFVVVTLCSSASVAQRRDFAGTYSISHVAESTETVDLTLTVVVKNFSGHPIADCVIVLDGTDPHQAPIGNFDPIDLLPASRFLTLRHSFAVPRGEFVRWEQGVAPALRILIPDGHGGTIVDAIDVHRVTPAPVEPAE